ncbi:Polyhomeotic-like protein 3 [Acipenser ruthenus]|uniref:Polyhomeotic-like protein 3 n=1 Tax=Acipenser ruthenus TaxID=7906 RepID=A0A444TZ61_ACIRT|nr:Polyhomeotic-like protein 3 [Acipenser ruthenus]
MENETSTTTSATTTTSSTPSRTQAPQLSLYSSTTERQAVQVIQQAIHRPPSMAAQYLQQMYAAQQQHLMLRTAALQQQHHLSSSQLQSLAAVQQATLSGKRQASSPTASVTQQSSVSQTSINLSTSPAVQLISRSQTSSTAGSGGGSSLGQQSMLLGNSSPTLTTSQAQMYLRAQMLILTPSATVAAVQPDIPVVSSPSSSQTTATQVQNLTLRPHQPSTLTSPQSVPLKATSQGQPLAVAHPKMSVCPLKPSQQPEPLLEGNKKGENPITEPKPTTLTRLPGDHQLIAPASYPLLKHQPLPIHAAQPQKGPNHQLIIQQQPPLPHQVQPIALQVSRQETPPPSLAIQTQVPPPTTISVQSQHCTPITATALPLTSSPGQSQPVQQQTVVVSPPPTQSPTSQSPTIVIQPQALIQSQPHALISAPMQLGPAQLPILSTAQVIQPHLSPVTSPIAHIGPLPYPTLISPSINFPPQPTHQQQPPPPQASLGLMSSPPPPLPQLSHTPPAQLQPLPLQSVQALAVQSEILTPGQMLVSEEELPAAEALVQMPYQGLPPPQTVAVNLQPTHQQQPPPPQASLGLMSSPPPPLPQLSHTPPAQLQPLPLQSVQALAVQSEILTPGQMLVSEEELPAAEALVQMPYQGLPPPQTVAVNLQVQHATPMEAPVVYQVEGMCEEEMREDREECLPGNRTPTPPALSPPAGHVGDCEESSTHQDISTGLPGLVNTSGNTSVIRSSSDPSYITSSPPPPLPHPPPPPPPPPPLPPTLLPAVVKSPCKPVPAVLPENKLPQAIVKPHILTHLIEGFVIQEGLEPFPVSRSSLLTEKKEKQCEQQVMEPNREEPQSMMETEQPEHSTDSDMDDIIAEGVMEETVTELLKCEFCGKMGYAHKFLRSKRFCSKSCAKRFNVSCTKRVSLLKADKGVRWTRKPDGRRGRRPRGAEGGSREHLLRQLPATYPATGGMQPARSQSPQEDTVPVAMTTRLRRQSEQGRERDLRVRHPSGSNESLPSVQSDPTQWTVNEVWAFIYALPGCQDIAAEFRAQEIDGQALLLLKEDHLMSAMNIKLGPALKICARINTLKEP